MRFTLSEKGVSATELAHLEEELKLVLPEDYKALILSANGGFPDKEYIKGISIEFLAFKYGEFPVERALDSMKNWIPPGFLPIGMDAGGWPFCLDLNPEEDYGKVFFLPVDSDEKRLIANSVSELLDELTNDPVC